MADEEDAEQAAMARLRGQIIRLQSEQARRRELIRRHEQRDQALREELHSRKDEAAKLSNIIEYEESKLANAALQQQNLEATHALEKTEALKASCASLLDEFIPGVYSATGNKFAEKRAAKLAEGAGGGDDDGDRGKEQEVFHDVLWVTYVRPKEEFNFQMTLKIATDTRVMDLLTDLCEYWGCSERQNVLFKGEVVPIPMTQHRVTLNASITAQRDPLTKRTQKEELIKALDPETGECIKSTILGNDIILEGDQLLGIHFAEDDVSKWLEGERSSAEAEENTRATDDLLSPTSGAGTKPWSVESVLAPTAEDDQLIFQFAEDRRVQEVLPLTDIAHLYLVHKDDKDAWVQRVLAGKKRIAPGQENKQDSDVNMGAARAAEYPTCLEVTRGWPGLFYDMTHPSGQQMIKSTLRNTQCRDVFAYVLLFFFTLLALASSVDRTRGFWATDGLRGALVLGRGSSDLGSAWYTANAGTSTITTRRRKRKRRKRKLQESVEHHTVGQNGGDQFFDTRSAVAERKDHVSRGRTGQGDDAGSTSGRRRPEDVLSEELLDDGRASTTRVRRVLSANLNAEVEEVHASIDRRHLATLLPTLDTATFVPLPEIRGREQIWAWMIGTLAEQVFSPRSRLWSEYQPAFQMIIRQQRVKTKANGCGRNAFLELWLPQEELGALCYEPNVNSETQAKTFDVSTTVMENFVSRFITKTPRLSNVTSGDPLTFAEAPASYVHSVAGSHNTYDGSGFVVYYDTKYAGAAAFNETELAKAKYDFVQDMIFLRHNDYLDVQSRAFLVELTTYHPTLKTYVSLSIVFELQPTGAVQTSTLIEVAEPFGDGTGTYPSHSAIQTLTLLRFLICLYLGTLKPYLRIREVIFDMERLRTNAWRDVVFSYSNMVDSVLVAFVSVIFFARSAHVLPKPAEGDNKLLPGQFLSFVSFYSAIEQVETVLLFAVGLQCMFLLSFWNRFFLFWKIVQGMFKIYFFYFLVMTPLFFGCAVLATAVWGSHLSQFRSYFNSSVTIALVGTGYVPDLSKLADVSYAWTVVLSFLYIFGFAFISMNGYSAILVQIFEQVYLRHAQKTNKGWLQETLWEYTSDDVIKYVLPSVVYDRMASKRGRGDGYDDEEGEHDRM
ncbi:unnamed protein product [Amoebophrya sp. A25]|nr:unnamed protein product [Amoebophrya sp. A25]|eukprot:GSA25T00012362001.1